MDADVDTFDGLRLKAVEALGFPADSLMVLIHQTKIINKTDALISTVPAIKDGDRLIVMKKNVSKESHRDTN